MSDEIQSNLPPPPPRLDLFRQHPPLPAYLARRLLREGEEVAWVRGPRWSPSWERYITHPILFIMALPLAAGCLAACHFCATALPTLVPVLCVAAGGIFFGSIYVLAIANAYFTRLVVTNFRLFILQGHEVCRSWRIDDLPMRLIRYARRRNGVESRSIDLDALQTMLGGDSGQFADAKTIRAFGKELKRMSTRPDERP